MWKMGLLTAISSLASSFPFSCTGVSLVIFAMEDWYVLEVAGNFLMLIHGTDGQHFLNKGEFMKETAH